MCQAYDNVCRSFSHYFCVARLSETMRDAIERCALSIPGTLLQFVSFYILPLMVPHLFCMLSQATLQEAQQRFPIEQYELETLSMQARLAIERTFKSVPAAARSRRDFAKSNGILFMFAGAVPIWSTWRQTCDKRRGSPFSSTPKRSVFWHIPQASECDSSSAYVLL